MDRSLRYGKNCRVLGCVIVAIITVIWMRVFQRYASLPPNRALTGAVAAAATLLTWLVTGLVE
jgi:hypothetical protein